MSKFCTKCGKKLEEGKKCNCQDNVSQKEETTEKEVVAVVKKVTPATSSEGFFDNLKKVLKDVPKMFSSPKELMEEEKIGSTTWISAVLIQTVALFISFLIGANKVISLVSSSIGYGFSTGSIKLSDIPFEIHVKVFFICALGALAFLFIFVTLIYLLLNNVYKVKCNYKDILNKMSYPSLIISVAVPLAILGSFIHSYVASAIIGFGTLYFIVVAYNYIKSYLKDENKSMLYSPIIITLTTVLGGYVLQKIIEIIFE